METWRPVVGFGGYEVSDAGRVRSSRADKGHRVIVMKPGVGRDGYLRVPLSNGRGTKRKRPVHVLVLEAFVGPCPPGHQTRHLNRTRSDNRLSNLAWGTALENAADRDAHGTTARGLRQGTHTKPESRLRGHRHGRAILCEADVVTIREERARGVKLKTLADRYRVSESTIHLADKGRNWRHVGAA